MSGNYPENVYSEEQRQGGRRISDAYLREVAKISEAVTKLAEAMSKTAETHAEIMGKKLDKVLEQFDELKDARARRGEQIAVIGNKVESLENDKRDQWGKINDLTQAANEGKGVRIFLSTAIPAGVSIAIWLLTKVMK